MISEYSGPKSSTLFAIALWALGGICALLAIRMAVLLVDGVEVDFEPIALSPSPAPETAPPVNDWRMFGAAREPDYGFPTELPATPLQLRLRGVVTGERGYAIIVDAQGNEGVYRVGDEVPGQAELVSIEARRVVLARAGEREALELPGASRASVAANAPAPVPRSDERPGLANGVGIGSLSSITSRFSLDPEAIANRITILPVAGGGFRIRAGRDAAIFTQLGFHANDVVLAINGQPVDGEADVRAIFENYSPDQPLAITVRRGDRQRVLTPNLADF